MVVCANIGYLLGNLIFKVMCRFGLLEPIGNFFKHIIFV